ncbi:16702_t:CDS:2 [Dentiscutata heterogama]|uniref:16702_t:CDS:1 n=1 Tax=Dentiscutata heterogama TaxID=1316150 RepID=A0ACA9K7F4_9GLOM|nr:16702_t:CDS:2 [Dentiscutata heterogama]
MPRKNHNKNTKKKLNVKLRLDDKNVNEIIKIVKKLIKEHKSFISRQLYRKEVTTKNHELENSKLKELENQIDSLNSKAIRLENDKILYETENNKLKEKLKCITNLYEENKSDLERYYNVIQRTYSILQEAFSSNEIDISQLAGLCNEIKDVCEGSEVGSNISSAGHSTDNIVYSSFDDALSVFEPKIVEVIEENDSDQNFPSLNRFLHFYEHCSDPNDQKFYSF